MLHWFERGQRIRWLLPLAVALAVCLIVVTEASFRTSAASLGNIESRSAAYTAINTVVRRLLDAETAQRGYLITNRLEYLAPRQAVEADLAEAIQALSRHYAQDQESLARVRELDARAKETLSALDTTQRLFEEGAHDRWRDLMSTNIGKEKMDAMREVSDRLLATEAQRLRGERASILATQRISRWAVLGLSLVILLALAQYVRQTRNLAAIRERFTRELQAERDELENQVRRRTSELTELAQHLQNAREDERSRLARELHDELGALLTAARLDVARLKRGLGAAPAEVHARLAHLVSTIEQGVALKRRVIEDLRPSSLSNLGLVAALDIQAREFAQRAALKVHTTLEPVRLSEAGQITAYRVVQESFTNIAKYAQASTVTLVMKTTDGRVRLAVSDDGRGFDPAQRTTATHGLTGMRYRVEAVGGKLAVRSAPGQGTCIEAWIPETADAAPL